MGSSLVPEVSASDLLSDAFVLDELKPDINLVDGTHKNKIFNYI